MTHLILAGFMGTGKSTIGRLLAERLRLPFIDVDTEIEAAAGKSIPAIFAADGETAFRALETQVLARLLKRDSAVMALGGGALTIPDNVMLAKRAGPVICLTADPSVIYQRVSREPGQRPLLKVADPLAKIRDLLETRQASYLQADVQIDTSHLEPAGVVDEVMDWLERVRVDLGERSYDIHLAEGCHTWAGPLLAKLPERVSSAVIVSNREIDQRYGKTLRESLKGAGIPYHTLLVPAGEKYKSLDTANRLYGDLIRYKTDRKSVIIALGGGVIGDMAGFVAGTYQRGIRFMQVPTTLLAQVDSSVGGKVGVNHPQGKNMIGVFLQPQVVLIDPSTLATLPMRELRSGLAEVVKYGAIWDESFFDYLEGHVDNILRLEPEAIKHIVRRSCQIKAHVVEEDETEGGLRAILNFGHTAAHAVETYTCYNSYTHGEAVAIGMVVAARIAHSLGMLRAEPLHRLTRLLERFGLPTHLPKADPGVLMGLMDTDKKAVAGQVRFVLPRDLGKVEIVKNVPRDLLRRSLKESIEL
ncbi:MAG: 3-dehydroquinate synthase [Armatimonadota bacterium]